MNELIIFSLGIVLGFFSCVVVTSLSMLVVFRRFNKDLKDKLKAAVGLEEKTIKIKERLSEVRSITEQQLTMQSRVEYPQKNAADGKYKNSLIRQIKDLEEKKALILQSIIDDGFDPVVRTIGPSGTTEEIRLSEFMGKYGPVSKKDEKVAKVINKFTVLPGGKGSGEDGSGNNTTH